MGTNAPLCTDKKLWGDRSTFKIRLKTLLFHKAYRVRSGSGEAEPSLSCASVGSGCWGTFWAIFPFTLDIFIHPFCMPLHFVYSFTWFVLSSSLYTLPFPPSLFNRSQPVSARSFFLLKESLSFPLSPKVLLMSGDMIVGVFFIIWSYIIKTELKTFRKLDLSPWGHRFELVQEFQELHGWGETPTSLHSSASYHRGVKILLSIFWILWTSAVLVFKGWTSLMLK